MIILYVIMSMHLYLFICFYQIEITRMKNIMKLCFLFLCIIILLSIPTYFNGIHIVLYFIWFQHAG